MGSADFSIQTDVQWCTDRRRRPLIFQIMDSGIGEQDNNRKILGTGCGRRYYVRRTFRFAMVRASDVFGRIGLEDRKSGRLPAGESVSGKHRL